jgi:stage V sporulation protein R
MRNTQLPPDLQAAWDEIEGYARAYGLDFYPISFEVLDYRTLYQIAAFGGFPTRYPHWRFGMEFDQLIKGHTYGLSIIYEMVINNNPSYAYLLEGNDLTTQKMVMAHVTGHVDFFKNNLWFSHTNRHMLDTMANHAVRISNLIDRIGYDQVEDFIDICLSLENLIDYHAPYIRRPEAQTVLPITEEEGDDIVVEGLPVDRDYMKTYINPPEFLEEQRRQLDDDRNRLRKFPENPQKDVLLFLLLNAPLERWQHTVLEIIRNEAYYFAPQAMTKIINEGWACLTAGAWLFTEEGPVPIEHLVERRMPLRVSDGEALRRVYDWTRFHDRATMSIRTRRGFELAGSTTHRVMLADGQWRRLDELAVGDSLRLTPGPDLWAREPVTISWQPSLVATMLAGEADAVATPWEQAHAHTGSRDQADVAWTDTLPPAFDAIRIPAVLDERLATWLGYLIGAGNHGAIDHQVGFTTASEEIAEHGAGLVQDLFGLHPLMRRSPAGWHVDVSSEELGAFLSHLGYHTEASVHVSQLPELVVRSPRPVVQACLRAIYDCAAHVDDQGLVLRTSSEHLGRSIQVLLLNFGILSARSADEAGEWLVRITGNHARLFQQEIGMGLQHKLQSLQRYVEEHSTTEPAQDWHDSIIVIEPGQADVYDISVEATHRYAAQGFINHNSYWHSEIMTKRAARDSEIIDFAEHHSGVVATSPGRLNPYKLGLELLRDIEERWNKGKFGKEWDNCDDLETKRNWDRQTGLGREKLFEVRRFHNDITFIDEFLTPEFAVEQKLFTFQYNRDTDLYEILSREFSEVKQKLLYRLTNFGQPFIYVEDGNYANRGELYLRHRHEGIDLRLDYARDTLRNLQKIWTRPVHLETVLDDKKRLLTFDGRDYSERRIE